MEDAKFLLKLSTGPAKGRFEEVDKYTFDHYKQALADDGESPRYEPNSWVVVNDGITVQLCNASMQDLSILVRGLNLPSAPPAVGGQGFIHEKPKFIKFVKGKGQSMLETQTGKVYHLKAA